MPLIDRVAVPGKVVGSTRLLSGQVVPVIEPELRGLVNWNFNALFENVKKTLADAQIATTDESAAETQVRNFLNRIYHEYRNLGTRPQDRALNFMAANAITPALAIYAEVAQGYALESISIERSPICQPGSECWDIKAFFLDPTDKLNKARRVQLFTVDVSDVIPVAIRQERSWFLA